MRTLLIGGTGPTGPLIANGLLQRGARLTVLNRGLRAPHRPEDTEQVVADPNFAESVERALAGRHFDVVVASYGRLRRLIPVFAAATDRLVTIGGTAYAGSDGLPTDEDSPRRLENKLVQRIVETEKALQDAHDAGLFSLTHLRYPLLWGPGQIAPKEWSIARRVQDGRPFIPVVAGGRTIETKCFVANAAAAVLRTVDQPQSSSGRTYNVTDALNPDDLTRLRDLATALGRPEVGVLDLPEAATGPAGFWAVGRDLDYAREHRPPRTEHALIDSTRIRRELGHQDVVTYIEAVEQTAAHLAKHPLARGGPDEAQIGDPFDYAAEDAYAQLVEAFTQQARAIPFAGTEYRHQYDHPPAG